MVMGNLNLHSSELASMGLPDKKSWHWLEEFYAETISSELERYKSHGAGLQHSWHWFDELVRYS